MANSLGRKTIKVGDSIGDRIRITKALNKCFGYQWFEAIKDGDTRYLLQIPAFIFDQAKPNQELISSLFDYFAKLRHHNFKGLVVADPQGYQDYPLVLEYAHKEVPNKLLTDTLKSLPIEKRKEACKEYFEQIAFEILHDLHYKGLHHGLLVPDSFLINPDKNKVYIRNLGCMHKVILEYDHSFLKQYREYLAPEFKGTLTTATDIYAFAKTVGYWDSRLQETHWYRKATHPDPAERYSKMRELYVALSQALDEIFSSNSSPPLPAPIPEPTPDPLPDPNPDPDSTPRPGPGIVPKYTLTLNIAPEEGGRVYGDGDYPSGRSVEIFASPNSGWKFERWSGDIQNTQNPTQTLTIDDNLALTAHFLKEEEFPEPSSKPRRRALPIPLILGAASLGMIVLLTQSPHITFLCQPIGNCKRYEKVYDQATIEAEEAIGIAQMTRSQANLEEAQALLQSSITQLNEIPENAKIYPIVQKRLEVYQIHMETIDARLAPPLW